MKNQLELSIIIPVYNESANILKVIKEIQKNIKVNYELIIVYDFDEDSTLPVLKRVKNIPHLLIVKNTIAKGPSGAIRTGINIAQSQRILVTMADLCDDLTQVDKLLSFIPKHAAIACPSRYSKGGKQQLTPSIKVWAPKSAGKLLKIFAGIPTYDPTNSFKLYSKELLDRITLQSTVSFSVTLEIVVKAHALGYAIVEIPTVWRDRQHGKTNFKLGQSLIAYFPWFCYAVFHRMLSRKNSKQLHR